MTVLFTLYPLDMRKGLSVKRIKLCNSFPFCKDLFVMVMLFVCGALSEAGVTGSCELSELSVGN